jgi:hypothetical protein
MERLADHWGRAIRYGGPPDEPDATMLLRGALVTRRDVVQYMVDLSKEIDDAERRYLALRRLQRHIENVERQRRGAAHGVLTLMAKEALRIRRDEAEKAQERMEGMFAGLTDIGELVPTVFDVPQWIPEHGETHCVVVYERRLGRLLRFETCGLDDIRSKRVALEAEYGQTPGVEVVLLSSASRQDLLQTHGRYFEGVADLAKPGH